MNKTLIFLILVIVVLCWKVVFTDSKVEYTDPAKILQGITMAFSYKTAVREYWQEEGKFPGADDWAGLEDKPQADISKSLVESIAVAEEGPGVITLYFTNKPGIEMQADISDTRILLIPNIEDGKLKWRCEGTVPTEIMPGKCLVLDEAE